jgi:hypothetical protein
MERVKFWRWCGLTGVGVLALIIMLTQSRGAMLAVGTGTLMLVVTSQRRGRDLALLTLLVGGAAIMAPKGVWERLAGLANVSVEEGMQDVDPEGVCQVSLDDLASSLLTRFNRTRCWVSAQP